MDADLERRIRLAYEAFARGEIEAVLDNFEPDSQLANPD